MHSSFVTSHRGRFQRDMDAWEEGVKFRFLRWDIDKTWVGISGLGTFAYMGRGLINDTSHLLMTRWLVSDRRSSKMLYSPFAIGWGYDSRITPTRFQWQDAILYKAPSPLSAYNVTHASVKSESSSHCIITSSFRIQKIKKVMLSLVTYKWPPVPLKCCSPQ